MISKSKIISITLVALFMMSFTVGIQAVPQSNVQLGENAYSVSQDDWHDYQNGTYLWWEQDSNTSSDEWSWEHRNWLFGPSPSFEIYHENGTLLTKDSYVDIGEQLIFRAIVPKGVLQGAELGGVQFYGWYISNDWNYSANFDFGFHADGWDLESTWNAWSWEYNSSIPEIPGPETPEDPFIDIIPASCSNYSTDNNYFVEFAIIFNSDASLGLYEMNMDVQDSDHNMIGSYNFVTGGNYQFNGLAVGMSPDLAFSYSYSGSYTLQKLDMDGDILYSISRGKDFMMRFNVTGGTPEIVRLDFWMPSGLDVLVNVTGWHQELVTEYGGWEYDNTTETYVYNPSLEVTYMKDVYGPYQERRWMETGTGTEISALSLYEEYDEYGYPIFQELRNETYCVDKQLMLVYNTTSESFDTFYGYSYYGYPYDTIQPDTRNEEITVYEPIPPEMTEFFILNNASSAYSAGSDFVVEFVGQFTYEMPKSTENSYLMFDDMVIGQDGFWYNPSAYDYDRPRQTQSEYELAKQVAIETPVTIAKILTADGKEPSGRMFSVEKGEPFMVKGRLQGGGAVSTDIDAVLFSMEAYDGFWSETESWWSQLFYEVIIDVNGTPSFKAYNWTEKQNYTYGTYEDYVYTNTTGWHDVYNEVTNTWEWTYGEYWTWMWAEVDGWHWEWYYFNQKTGEWQTEWMNQRSPETQIPALDFCSISDFNKWSSGGDLYASFLLNMSQNVADTSYWWNFAFMNNTWYEDYSSEWGEHKVFAWDTDLIYSFNHPVGGDRVYVEPIQYNQLYFNGTFAPDEMIPAIERPYIVIDGEKLPIKVKENYDPWSTTTWTEMLFYERWDYETQHDIYYYELVNGTKIYVTYDNVLQIYNVTLGNGVSFLTGQEWENYWYYGGQQYYSWTDIYGTIYQGTDYATYVDVTRTPAGKATPDEDGRGYFVRYGLDSVLEITDYWTWDSREQTYFMTDTSGHLYRLTYNDITGYYEAIIDSVVQQISCPQEYRTADYNSETVSVIGGYSTQSWYHDDGNTKHEMPYPGANADWEHQLRNTVSEGGLVPTTKSLTYMGINYPVTYDEFFDEYSVKIGATVYPLIYDYANYVIANNTYIWNPETVGYLAETVTFDGNIVPTLYKEVELGWGYEYVQHNAVDDYDYIVLTNGTMWVLNYTVVFPIYEYEYNSQTFYSTQNWPYYNEEYNATTDSYTSYNYYELLNGSWITMTDYVELFPVSTTMGVGYYNYSTYEYVYGFMGTDYIYNSSDQCIWMYKIHNSTFVGDIFIDMNNVYQRPIIEFDYDGYTVQASPHKENIQRLRNRWGHNMVYGPKAITSSVYKNYHDFVVGNPEWGMWGIKSWDISEDNGALDLDGNFDTTDDQYYVQELYNSSDSWTHTWNNMWTYIEWDPNGTIWGDEMNVHSWLGLNTFTWSYEWEQEFYWFHADDFSSVTSAEMTTIIDTLLSVDDEPNPGYWDIAFMARNVTWEDIVLEAQENGWDWITSNEQEWTWLSFGVGQNFGTSVLEDDVEHWIDIGINYEFSGLMVWEDINENGQMDVDLFNTGSQELSHYLMPDSASSVRFVSPGEAYGNNNASGQMRLELTDEVTWGVSFYDVNGTVFPYGSYGYWDWYDGVVSGSDMRTFDERPTKVTIDEISFLVHFQGYVNETADSINNYAEVKIDNYVGNWDVDMTGGRDNLENKSLALNYFADVHMSDFAFKANGSFTDNEQTVSSDIFEMESAGAKFAEMVIGGNTYDWSKNTTAPYDVVSYTTPIGAFRNAFESDSGQSATAWSFSSQMFYVTIGFTHWEGYSVYQDPVFVAYVSSTGNTARAGEVSFGQFEISPTVPESSDSVDVSVDIYVDESININDVNLVYWSDSSGETTVDMTTSDGTRYTGTIPPHDDGEQVWFRVEVHTDENVYMSPDGSYVVGQGIVTTSTTTPTGPIEGLSTEMILLIVGGAVIAVVSVMLVKRHRSSSGSYSP